MATVSLISASANLLASVDRALSLIGQDRCVKPGDRVLLKPNLHGGPGHTSPELMEALVRWCLDHGAGQVTIGDGGYWGMTDGSAYFAQTGMAGVAERTGARLVFFHAGDYRVCHPDNPALPETLGISEYVYEADVVINVPIPKTHFNTLITITLKNMKGCLRPVDKKRFHEMDLNAALGAMNTITAPLVTVHLLDGTIGYEGMGPGAADPFPWGLLAASTDPVALDATACRLMGMDPAHVRLVQECARLGVGVWREDEVEVVGERLSDHRRRFVLPHEAAARAFPGLRIMSERACSVCMEALFRGLEMAGQQGQSVAPLALLIGAGPQSEADVLIGRCACAGVDDERALPGCPPTPEAICGRIVNTDSA
jgi:uncharacterized protein (DUF362 family)